MQLTDPLCGLMLALTDYPNIPMLIGIITETFMCLSLVWVLVHSHLRERPLKSEYQPDFRVQHGCLTKEVVHTLNTRGESMLEQSGAMLQ